jgi:hypothetical protein
MGKMGNGYGSEFHLLRYLGYHRHSLNLTIETKSSGKVIDWLDFAFGREEKADREWRGVDFVDSTRGIKSAHVAFWPQSGNRPNWDAVGRLESNSGVEYLLVEAKAHVEELRSTCSASGKGGLSAIRNALGETIAAHHFDARVEEWLSPYYQYANRLAHLHFLLKHDIPARLIFIYFCGDDWGGRKLPSGRPPKCPKNAQEWTAPLKVMRDRLGLIGRSKLEQRVHSVFLRV